MSNVPERLYFRGFSNTLSSEDIRKFFDAIAPVRIIFTDRSTDEPWGYVQFTSAEDANAVRRIGRDGLMIGEHLINLYLTEDSARGNVEDGDSAPKGSSLASDYGPEGGKNLSSRAAEGASTSEMPPSPRAGHSPLESDAEPISLLKRDPPPEIDSGIGRRMGRYIPRGRGIEIHISLRKRGVPKFRLGWPDNEPPGQFVNRSLEYVPYCEPSTSSRANESNLNEGRGENSSSSYFDGSQRASGEVAYPFGVSVRGSRPQYMRKRNGGRNLRSSASRAGKSTHQLEGRVDRRRSKVCTCSSRRRHPSRFSSRAPSGRRASMYAYSTYLEPIPEHVEEKIVAGEASSSSSTDIIYNLSSSSLELSSYSSETSAENTSVGGTGDVQPQEPGEETVEKRPAAEETVAGRSASHTDPMKEPKEDRDGKDEKIA